MLESGHFHINHHELAIQNLKTVKDYILTYLLQKRSQLLDECKLDNHHSTDINHNLKLISPVYLPCYCYLGVPMYDQGG